MKVAIVGTCPSSRLLSQRLPSDWKIWACAPGNEGVLQRVDLWFELHGDLDFPSEGGMWQPYFDWVNKQSFPVFAQDTKLIPRAMRFPVEELLKEFGYYFFSSQPAWMFAYAIHIKAKEIGLYGHQKPAILHFAQIAAQHNIKVLVPPESEVLQPPPLYGYNYNSPIGRKLRTRQREVEEQVRELDEQIEMLRMKRQHFRGVLDENDWSQQTWTGGLYKDDDLVYITSNPSKE